MRTRIVAGAILAIVSAVSLQAIGAKWTTTEQAKSAQPCRIGATAATTRTEGQKGFWSEVTTACRFDKATSQSTCTNEYVDSVGTKTTTVSVTTFASLADAIDEVKVIAPLRLSRMPAPKYDGSASKPGMPVMRVR